LSYEDEGVIPDIPEDSLRNVNPPTLCAIFHGIL